MAIQVVMFAAMIIFIFIILHYFA